MLGLDESGRMPLARTRGYAQTAIGALHYLQAGDGPPLLLLPQSGRSYGMFGGLIEALRPRFTLLTADLPGSGNSDPLPAGAGYKDVAAAFVALLDTASVTRADVYGIHTGNKIAAALAAHWPERVRRVVLAGQSHSIIPDQETRNAAVLAHMSGQIDLDRAEAAKVMPQWAQLLRDMTSHWWRADALAGLGSARLRSAVIARVIEDLQAFEGKPRLYAENLAYDLGADLARIRAPTLLIEIATPAEDREVGRQAGAVQALVPRCNTIVLEAADGFALTLEDRVDQVAGALTKFLCRPPEDEGGP